MTICLVYSRDLERVHEFEPEIDKLLKPTLGVGFSFMNACSCQKSAVCWKHILYFVQ